MSKARKRQNPTSDRNYNGCLVSKTVNECAHCSYVLHELLNHEKRWLSIAMRVMKNEQNAEDLVHEFYSRKLPVKIHKLNIDDPTFNLLQYTARMVRNFAIDELYRTSRHSVIDAKYYVEGITRHQEDQVIPNIIKQVEAREALSLIPKIVSQEEQGLLNRMLTPGWSISEEAFNEKVTPTAIRARIARLRKKLSRALNTPPHSA